MLECLAYKYIFCRSLASSISTALILFRSIRRKSSAYKLFKISDGKCQERWERMSDERKSAYGKWGNKQIWCLKLKHTDWENLCMVCIRMSPARRCCSVRVCVSGNLCATITKSIEINLRVSTVCDTFAHTHIFTHKHTKAYVLRTSSTSSYSSWTCVVNVLFTLRFLYYFTTTTTCRFSFLIILWLFIFTLLPLSLRFYLAQNLFVRRTNFSSFFLRFSEIIIISPSFVRIHRAYDDDGEDDDKVCEFSTCELNPFQFTFFLSPSLSPCFQFSVSVFYFCGNGTNAMDILCYFASVFFLLAFVFHFTFFRHV